MASYVIYNPTSGFISGVFSVLHSANDAELVAANTPSGMSALEVDPSNPVITNQKGWVVTNGALAPAPEDPATVLSDAKNAKLSELATSYEAEKSAGVSYMGTTFMTDDSSQQIFAHALLAYSSVGATPDGFFVVDAAYNKVPMDLDQLKGLISAIAAQVWTTFQRWVTVREQLAAAATPEDVQAISW